MSVGIVGLDVSDGWRVTQGREIRCEDKQLLRECLASGFRLTPWWVAWMTTQKRQLDGLTSHSLEGTEEFVDFVGGVEIGFQFAGVEAFAEIVEAAGEEVEGGGEDFAIGEDDVAPGGVGAASEAQGIAQARAGYGDG